jgi:glycosyltransferase involved in cell wall biosynthesis
MVTQVQVSVVVPTRDRHELLAEALASIRAIEGPDLVFEILVCDNGTDRAQAAAVAARFGAQYLEVAEAGAGAARNAGLLAATSEYVAFLDDDDLWLPEHIRPQLALLEAHPEYAAVVGQTVTTDDRRTPMCEPWPVALPDSGNVFQEFLNEYPQIGATVVRTRVRESVGLFDVALFGDQDWEWHLRLARQHGVGFVTVPSVLFRQRPAGTFDGLQWKRLGYMRRVLFRTLMRAGGQRPALTHSAHLILRHHGEYYRYFRESAARHIAAGEHRDAWTALFRALASSPPHAARDMAGSPGIWAMIATLILEVRH